MREIRWTDEQVAAITSTGNVLLAASAGTGKTTTIVGRVLWLLGLEVGVRDATGEPIPRCPDPCTLEEVAAITFTEKAAYDLKAKLRKEIERSERGAALRWEVDRASVGTIHGFCGELLRDHALRMGIDPTFRVLDERETRLEQDRLIRDVILDALKEGDPGAVELVRRFGLYSLPRRRGTIDHARAVLRDIRWRARRYEGWTRHGEVDARTLRRTAEEAGIRAAAGEDAERDEAALAMVGALHRVAFRALRRWLSWLEEENVRDFDSLILDARRLLTRRETRPALESIRRRYHILIIDEFQDTDGAQRDIAFAIAGIGGGASGPPKRPRDGASGAPKRPRNGPRLFLVGDPKQSIYRFRGADITVWNQVRGALCGEGEPMRLSHNFRSEPAVVGFVNRVSSRAMDDRGEALVAESPESRVGYSPLVPRRPATAASGLEWLAVEPQGSKAERQEREARLVASRIRELVGRVPVTDPETGRCRPCAYRDIAILARKRDNLSAIERGLREYGIPSYNSSTGGLADRQEVMDLVTALRLLDNPRDDLRAFAYLRSPFVGLRDEVLARIRLDPATGRTDYLRQAERFLEGVDAGGSDWYPAAESPRVAEVEREALRNGLAAIREAQRLVDRAGPEELLEGLIERTGYRLHLLLRPGAAEALANIERFLALLEEYRHLPLGSLLALWDRWRDQDLGIPQAPLFSREDDVVTLSTIHAAKGLEWPVVFLVATEEGPDDSGRRLTYDYWSDRRFGPVFMPKKEERGPRAAKLFQRALLEDHAEEARLLYVAATRARDRLVVAGPTEASRGYAAWLAVALEDAVEEHKALPDWTAGETAGASLSEAAADEGAEPSSEDLDAGGAGLPEAAPEDQLSLFTTPGARRQGEGQPLAGPGPPAAPARRPVVIFRRPGPVQSALTEPPVSLSWLEGLEPADWPRLVQPIPVPRISFGTSATELMLRETDRRTWELRYRHGVEPVWRFAPDSGEAVPPALRGRIIHGVLERIREEEEVARILNETIAGLDAPELEELLEPGTAYRRALEREIEGVVRSPEWRWYVEGIHYREIRFVHLREGGEWRQGAFDLYRPPRPGAARPDASRATAADRHLSPGGGDRDRHAWIIDVKTHRIGPEEVGRTAREYAVQVRVYREAATALLDEAAGPAEVRVALHFSHPNVAVEV